MTNIVVALVLTVPAILIPVAFVWYLNIAGIRALVKAAAKKKATVTAG